MLSDFVFAFFIGFVGRFIYGVLFSDFDGYKRRIVNFWIKSISFDRSAHQSRYFDDLVQYWYRQFIERSLALNRRFNDR